MSLETQLAETNDRLADRVRELAADRVNPLSVKCVACHVAPGAPCFATTASPVLDDGVHHVRRVDARLTAEGAMSRMLVDIGRGAR